MMHSLPTKTGYYWAQVATNGECEIVEVVSDSLGLKARRFGTPGYYCLSEIAVWAHPIGRQTPAHFDLERETT